MLAPRPKNLCRACRWSEVEKKILGVTGKVRMDEQNAICRHISVQHYDPVSGGTVGHLPCRGERAYNGGCGPGARHFEPREDEKETSWEKKPAATAATVAR